MAVSVNPRSEVGSKSESLQPDPRPPLPQRAFHSPFRHYAFIDYATQGYIALVGLIILLVNNPRSLVGLTLLLTHGAGLALIHFIIRQCARHPYNRLLDFFRHYYPILCYSGFYREIGLLNQMLYTSYLDPHFLRFEKWLFGWQPGLEFMERCPSRLLSEVLYASYFSYYLMIGGVGLALLLRDRRQFAHFVSVVSFVFYCCYLIYIFTPVVGPRILCRGIVTWPLPPDVVPATVPITPDSVGAAVFFRIMAWIYEHFETPGAAFPSSHVAVALCTLYFSFLYLRRIRWAHLTAAILLCVATVYGRYHYIVDVVAGFLTAALLVPLGNRLFFKFRKPEVQIPRETRTTDAA
jgi:membrane-associated phospholipid phosphatase